VPRSLVLTPSVLVYSCAAPADLLPHQLELTELYPLLHRFEFMLLHRLELVELELMRVLVLNEALGCGGICPLLHQLKLAEPTELGAA
jgi:hypothetical protein